MSRHAGTMQPAYTLTCVECYLVETMQTEHAEYAAHLAQRKGWSVTTERCWRCPACTRRAQAAEVKAATFPCPFCQTLEQDLLQVGSRGAGAITTRTYRCKGCSETFTTHERDGRYAETVCHQSVQRKRRKQVAEITQTDRLPIACAHCGNVEGFPFDMTIAQVAVQPCAACGKIGKRPPKLIPRKEP